MSLYETALFNSYKTLRYVSRFGPLTCLADFITILPASLGHTAAQWACVYKALEGPQMES